MTKKWNEEASKNNNLEPNTNFQKEELENKKIQFSVQEEFGIIDLADDEKGVSPHRGE